MWKEGEEGEEEEEEGKGKEKIRQGRRKYKSTTDSNKSEVRRQATKSNKLYFPERDNHSPKWKMKQQQQL